MIIKLKTEIRLEDSPSTILEISVKNMQPVHGTKPDFFTRVTDTGTDTDAYNITAKKFLELVAQTYNKEREADPTLPELPSIDNLILKKDDTSTFEEGDDLRDTLYFWSQNSLARPIVMDRRQEFPKKRIERALEGIRSDITVIAGGINPTTDQFVVVRNMNGLETLCLLPGSNLLRILQNDVFKNDERLYNTLNTNFGYGVCSGTYGCPSNDDNSAFNRYSIRIPLPDVTRNSYKIIEKASAATIDNTFDISDTSDNTAAKDALILLSTFISKKMEHVYAKWNDILQKGLVSFDAVAKVLSVGSNVVTKSYSGFLHGGIVTELEYKQPCGSSPYWHVSVQSMETDGKFFYKDTKNHIICDFSPKLQSLTDLLVRPVTDSEKCMLTRRGQIFRELAIGAHHKAYIGMMEGMRADGRIMIDVARSGMRLGAASARPAYYSMPTGTGPAYGSMGPGGAAYPHHAYEGGPMDKPVLEDSLLWTTPPSLPAFSFRLRRFGLCQIELMSEIIWHEDAWSKVVLPEAKKDLIHALVVQTRCQEEVDVLEKRRWDVTRLMNQTIMNESAKTKMLVDTGAMDVAEEIDKELGSRMDLVLGKGGGCTMLFHGRPGTGKTLTAEAISELLRRPLYTVTVGELGTNAESLERTLKGILDLAASWKAIILLDEADVFLAQRNSIDIKRNGLVSIFLRTIEYYNGVLILTTNLPGQIDEAFLSRIHIQLHYEPLEAAQRAKIWRNFLETLPPSQLNNNDGSRFDYDMLAERYELNGRQIRNVFHIAQTLARHKKIEPTQEMIEEVINYCTRNADDGNM